ncbi:MAG: L-seryl-tRNA(Sec) selenium transferase [Gemmatimonadaceae bacterium]
MTDPRRRLPSVNALLESEPVRAMLERHPRPLVTEAVRAIVDAAREDPARAPGSVQGWAEAVARDLATRKRPSLRPVINATGVVLHTNLGRAPLPAAAIDAMRACTEGHSNLEYDLDSGHRGSRGVHCTALLRELTGAQDGLVVNNGAAALVLALRTVACDREVIVSRGELVEIGGSFRIPDIMRESGVRLIEVGTTNRTHLEDYAGAISGRTGAIARVHRSNFTLEGFTAEVEMGELAELGRERGLPVIHDLGSGLLLPLDEYGLRGEPTVAEALRAGASVVTMSGDKLLGGPQAGIVAGDAALIARLRSNPLARALRVDKLTLSALEATLTIYRDPRRALAEIPTLRMLTIPVESVRDRAERLCAILIARGIRATVIDSEASVGGGAYPAARIPSAAISLGGDARHVDERLRHASPAVVGRIEKEHLMLDLRSVMPSADDALAAAVERAAGTAQ